MYCTITDKYDTDIERLFYQKLQTAIKIDEYREKIKEAWKTDKAEYIGKLGTIKYEFINYSLHDQTHSQSILQNIYRWLGKERAEKLSIGDLWLLLETAYSHDVGMATTYIDLEELWKDEEKIAELIDEINLTNDKEVIETLYKIREKSERTNFFKLINEDKLWPLKVRKAVTYIDATYFRKKHAEFSKKHILSKINFKINSNISNSSYIENRFYNIVAEIDFLHTQDEKKIEKNLKLEEDGFDTSGFEDDKIHPQMIAYLLRLGDVLDIKNNRFDLWVINYNGGLSKDSQLHYQKHESVRDFLVTPQKIEIEINSKDIDVCNCANDWFKSIENELQIITRKWNEVAPEQLKGFLMENWKLIIKYGNENFSADDFSKKLTTNSEKLMQLLSGKNIYNTNLVLFREYLQNAIDATKVKYAKYYLENKDFLEFIAPNNYKNIIPSDIQNYNDEGISLNKLNIDDLAIKINIEPKDDLHCIVKIIDQGVGMNNEGLNALFNIGKGWSGRSERKNFSKYPSWLNPTGGFGIGILSGFLLCDRITIETKTRESSQYIVEIHSPQKNAKIIKKINRKYYGAEGTIVSFELPYYTFIKEMRKFIVQNSPKDFLDKGFKRKSFRINDKTSLLMMVFESIKEIINYYIGSLIFPIKIYSSSLKLEYNQEKSSIFQCILNSNEQLNNMPYLTYWDEKYNCFVASKNKNKIEEDLQVLYKGIRVNVNFSSMDESKMGGYITQDTEQNPMYIKKYKRRFELINLIQSTFSIIDIYSDTVENILEITRDQLKDENAFIDLSYNVLYDFLYKLAIADLKKENLLGYFQEKLIEKLIIFYYKEVEKKLTIFMPLIKKIETSYFLGSISKSKNIKYYNIIEEIFMNLYEIFKLINSVEYNIMINQHEFKKYLKEKLGEIKPKCEKINKQIESVLDSTKEENETLYEYFSRISTILSDISDKNVNTKTKSSIVEEILSSLKNFINIYSEDIQLEWINNHKKYCFLELFFQKKDFALCYGENVDQKNGIKIKHMNSEFISQDYLFVNKKEYMRIKDILKENELYSYRCKEEKYINDNTLYYILNMEYTIKETKDEYENLLQNIKNNIENDGYFLINGENQLSKFDVLVIKDIPDFASNLLEENSYIINPFYIGVEKEEVNKIIQNLKNRKLRKKQLRDMLISPKIQCFKSTINYVSEINNTAYSEVEEAYIQLLSDVFELLD